jgi:catechol 2,3-dioxygenase-like lactoylglutathione lyase family enzyme
VRELLDRLTVRGLEIFPLRIRHRDHRSLLNLGVIDVQDQSPFSVTAWAGRPRASLGGSSMTRFAAADGTIAFFNLDGDLLLGLYERANLAKDASLLPGPPSSTEFSLGFPAGSQAEVDKLLRRVEAAGGTLTAPAHMRPFGVYSGYFTDPDGHLFEIA